MNNSECTIQENKFNSTPFYRCKQLEPMHNPSNDELETCKPNHLMLNYLSNN